jgi:hypothetical protein
MSGESSPPLRACRHRVAYMYILLHRGVDLCQTLGGPNPFPAHPYPLPLLPPFPSSLLLLPFVPPSPPYPPLPLPSLSSGGPGATPPENFFQVQMLAREF